MEFDLFNWDSSYVGSVWPLTTGIGGFLIFWILSHEKKLEDLFFSRYGAEQGSVYHFIFSKGLGVIFLAVIPIILCTTFAGFNPWDVMGTNGKILFIVLSTLVLGAIAIPLIASSAKKPETLEKYPQIRQKQWSGKTVLINITGWSAYLFGYELLFRGLLLFPLVDRFGVWPAIAINTTLYSTTHIAKGLNEAVAAIPTGILLCVLTLMTGNIWIAFLVHLIIALTNSFAALIYNKAFTIKWR
ncbi:MAG: lysostaphin resistance A-like protein [Bacteroidota bacterium]